jgi:hypothetical protein
MSKKLNIENIANELEGASLFFNKPTTPPLSDNLEKASVEPRSETVVIPKPETRSKPAKPLPKPQPLTEKTVNNIDTTPSIQESMHASMQTSNNASMHASKLALHQESIIETIRKAVKYVGKDSATYRFTPEEKKALLELSFSYKMQGYKTSENELTRIAINFLLEDQKQNGRNSVLQRVLDELNK